MFHRRFLLPWLLLEVMHVGRFTGFTKYQSGWAFLLGIGIVMCLSKEKNKSTFLFHLFLKSRPLLGIVVFLSMMKNGPSIGLKKNLPQSWLHRMFSSTAMCLNCCFGLDLIRCGQLWMKEPRLLM